MDGGREGVKLVSSSLDFLLAQTFREGGEEGRYCDGMGAFKKKIRFAMWKLEDIGEDTAFLAVSCLIFNSSSFAFPFFLFLFLSLCCLSLFPTLGNC